LQSEKTFGCKLLAIILVVWQAFQASRATSFGWYFTVDPKSPPALTILELSGFMETGIPHHVANSAAKSTFEVRRANAFACLGISV